MRGAFAVVGLARTTDENDTSDTPEPEIDALPCDITVGAGQLELALDCMASDGPELHTVSFTGDGGLLDPAALEVLLAFESGSERVAPPAAAAGLGVEPVDRGCEFEMVKLGCGSYKRTALAFSYGDDMVELFDGEAGTLGDAFGVLLARAQIGEASVDDPCFDVYRYIVVAQ